MWVATSAMAGTVFDDTTTSPSPAGVVDTSKFSGDRSGIFGGGQIGFNFMVNPNVLIGVEADLDGADLTESHDDCLEALRCSHVHSGIDWFGTVRGRLGYAQNNWLLFATGGLALEHESTTSTITKAIFPALIGQSATASGTDAGWTVGGGLEYMFMPNWSANLEYRYTQFDIARDLTFPAPATGVHVDTTDHINIMRFGLNYHFN